MSHKSGEYDKAIEYYTTLIDECGKADKADLYYLRGCAYVHTGNENNAALDLKRLFPSVTTVIPYIVICITNLWHQVIQTGLNLISEDLFQVKMRMIFL